MRQSELRGYNGLSVYYGDLHNHCGLSYGHGSLADALHNARLQLDFASVTVHAHWPDLPTDDPQLRYLVDYHEEGFRKAADVWPSYLWEIEQANEEGVFLTFPSYEWHSMQYGDYCVIYHDAAGDAEDRPILRATELNELRDGARKLQIPAFLVPHHIGYRQGYRGINWSTFSDTLTPVVEIFSFHGLSESSEGPYPYLHSMGPRDERGTAQYAWEGGHIFGVIGSTDHHNAFPGSYGYGKLAVWAEELSRAAIWHAIAQRRTYALTGDRIELSFAINNRPMGTIIDPTYERLIDVSVQASDSIDYVEVLHNNRVIHRENRSMQPAESDSYKVGLEVGWGERNEETAWEVNVELENGRIVAVQPRFRGYGPTDNPPDDAEFTGIGREEVVDGRSIRFFAKTRKNPSLHTAATEGLVLDIEGDSQTRILIDANGMKTKLSLADLYSGTRTFYTGGFVSPAVCVHRAVPDHETNHRFAFLHRSRSSKRDWYTVRVRQLNGQWAWSSPIWVESPDE